MFFLPNTVDSWIECCISITCIYGILVWHAYNNKTAIAYKISAYIVLCSISYYGGYTLCTHIIPYTITPFLTYIILLHMHMRKIEFVPATHHTPSIHNNEWLALCIKTIFNHPAAEEPITLVIEYSQAINSYLETLIKFDVPWNKDLFISLLYDPTVYTKLIVIKNDGLIIGWNATWTIPKPTFTEYKKSDLHTYYTKTTDAIVCVVNPKKRTCSIIHHGTTLEPKNISETIHYFSALSQTIHAKEPYAFKQEKTRSSHTIS